MLGSGLDIMTLAARRRGGGALVLPMPTELLMANRLNQMGYGGFAGSDGIDTNSNCRVSFFNQAGTDVTTFVLYFAGWRADATNEQDGYNAVNITASIEYPGSSFIQVTFGGSASYSLGASELKASDTVTLNIPAGAQFWVRTYVSVSAGQKWVQGYQVNTSRGEAFDFATGVDKTMSGTITNASATATRRGFGPIGIKATGFAGTPVKRAWASVGDSILMKAGDGNFDAKGSGGWQERTLTDRFPHANFAITGSSGSNNVPANFTRRLAALQAIGVTDILCSYGNNDLAGSRTYAQITSNITDIVASLTGVGLRVHYCTPLPRTTGTWLTAAGQTVSAAGGAFTGGAASRRVQVGDFLRDNSIGLSGVVDISDCVDVDSSNAVARGGGFWISGNGGPSPSTHLTATGAATDGATGDGIHPNVASLTAPGFGGHFIFKDAFEAYLEALPT